VPPLSLGEVFDLFGFIGMRVAPVTGHTGDGRDRALVILVEFEIFLVDFACHDEHSTGHILFRFGIAGEVKMMVRAVGGRCVTKIAMYPQGGLPGIHDLVQIVMADILWKYF
jgi:hypothetical protein